MAEEDLLTKARQICVDYANENPEYLDDPEWELDDFHISDTRVVLGNWTVQIRTREGSRFRYEVIFDKRKKETKLIVFKKSDEEVYSNG